MQRPQLPSVAGMSSISQDLYTFAPYYPWSADATGNQLSLSGEVSGREVRV